MQEQWIRMNLDLADSITGTVTLGHRIGSFNNYSTSIRIEVVRHSVFSFMASRSSTFEQSLIYADHLIVVEPRATFGFECYPVRHTWIPPEIRRRAKQLRFVCHRDNSHFKHPCAPCPRRWRGTAHHRSMLICPVSLPETSTYSGRFFDWFFRRRWTWVNYIGSSRLEAMMDAMLVKWRLCPFCNNPHCSSCVE